MPQFLAQLNTNSLLLALLAGLAIAIPIVIGSFARVLSPRTLRSPERMALDEEPGALLIPLLLGAGAFLLTPVAFVLFLRGELPKNDSPPLPPLQTVAMHTITAAAGLLVLLSASLRLRGHAALERLGMTGRHFAVAVLPGLLGLLFVVPLLHLIGVITAQLWKSLQLEHESKHSLLVILSDSPDLRLRFLLVMTAILIVPIFEEVLFRGHLQTFLLALLSRRRLAPPPVGFPLIPGPAANPIWSPDLMARPVLPAAPRPLHRWVAILLTSVAFSVVHPWWSIPPIFFLSLCLGYLYERGGNLWTPIIVHSLFNAFSITLSLFVEI